MVVNYFLTASQLGIRVVDNGPVHFKPAFLFLRNHFLRILVKFTVSSPELCRGPSNNVFTLIRRYHRGVAKFVVLVDIANVVVRRVCFEYLTAVFANLFQRNFVALIKRLLKLIFILFQSFFVRRPNFLV